MNPDQHHSDALDLLALGAAGALSADEYRTLEERLAADPALAREYQELQASAATLAEASSETPPPSLRASVLDAIQGVEQLPPVATAGERAVDLTALGRSRAHPRPASFEATEAPANVVSIRHRRWMIPASAAAAAVMLLVGGLLINRFADAPTDEDRIAEVLDDDSAVTIPLTGPLDGLRLVTSERADAAVLMGTGIEPPEDGRVFQLWAIHDDDKIGMATFTPTATGEVAMVMDGTDASAQWAVTVEPAGGSDQPTSDPVAVSPGLT